ncbi:MAG TPA: class I SAM-dependent methyltransferase [Sedimentisphaerales bacterium]|nr:class I SAM-dependent methyltransferase [Sedimentisphaerales bacterium]
MKRNQSKCGIPKLKLLPYRQYAGVDRNDPLRFYFWPVIGKIYRRRIELCLAECTGGQRVLEVGFGSGVTFPNLNDNYKEIYGLDLNVSVEDVTAVFKARQIETHLQNGSVLSMPYEDDFFDTVLLISILEHLKPFEQMQAFREIRRVLRPGGQAIYGVPIERGFLVLMFRLLGCNIREHHFSTEKDVFNAANSILEKVRVFQMQSIPSLFGPVYEVGHFVKGASNG